MTIDGALDLMREAFLVAAYISGPALGTALVVGLFVGVLQTATQVNEASVNFVMKLVAVAAALSIGGPWALQHMVEYTRRTIQSISGVVH